MIFFESERLLLLVFLRNQPGLALLLASRTRRGEAHARVVWLKISMSQVNKQRFKSWECFCFALIFHRQNLSRFLLDVVHFRLCGCVACTWPQLSGGGQPLVLSSSLGSDGSSFPCWLLFVFERFDNVSRGRFLPASYLEPTVLLGYVGHET